MSTPHNVPSPPPAFAIVDKVRDSSGLVVTITKRVKDGVVSFAIGKEFDRGGRTAESMYLNRRHLPALLKLLERLGPVLDQAEDAARTEARKP